MTTVQVRNADRDTDHVPGVVVQGVQRFRLKEVRQYRPFIKASIELLQETPRERHGCQVFAGDRALAARPRVTEQLLVKRQETGRGVQALQERSRVIKLGKKKLERHRAGIQLRGDAHPAAVREIKLGQSALPPAVVAHVELGSGESQLVE